ncbi:MAG: trypsin-like peptidase domain-containing protein [Firmicutes bacterium]|nr:trypsin-like peptidase domain-containing protein [Bacillota bacterium]
MIGNSLLGGSSPANHGSNKKASTSASGYTLEDATDAAMSVQEITDAAKPSVVEIKTESVTSDVWMQQYVTEGAGSGVIVTNDGYIVTNNHVIEGAGKIMVTLSDGSEYDAKLIGTDSMTDVAVIKIAAKGLTPATYGNSDQLAVGDLAVAIGNPLGELGGTVTAGIISALDRELVIDGQTMTLLQTDSSINPGNSGGGLFNDDGQLIGIVVAKSSGSDVEGLGFAIPINTAADVAQQLMDGGYVKGQPSTGMTYTENGGSADDFGMFFGGSSSVSVYIYSVDGKNAKKAGFKSGDLVYAVDGEVIGSFDDLSAIISKHKVGDKITYTIVRDGYTKDISFELEEKGAQ